MSRSRVIVFNLLVILALLATSSVQAQSDYQGWRVRAFAGIVGRFVEDDNTTFNDPTFGTSSTEVDGTGIGYGFDVERRFTKLFGLDLALSFSELDVEFTQSLTPDVSKDTLEVIPVWLAANFHVVNTEKLDFWVGPQIAYVFWNNPLRFDVPGQGTYTLDTEDEFPAFGFEFGLDYWLTEKSGLNFAFRFVDADADADHDLPVDPTFITVGYGWKF